MNFAHQIALIKCTAIGLYHMKTCYAVYSRPKLALEVQILRKQESNKFFYLIFASKEFVLSWHSFVCEQLERFREGTGRLS